MTVQQAYEAYVNLVYELLLSNCPVDTGNMKTHIKMNDNGSECEIIIETIPYTEARRKKSHIKKGQPETEYAFYTEYRNKSQGWIREDSLREAAIKIGATVDYRL